MANPLGMFCNQLIAFFDEMSEQFPEEKDLITASTALKGLKRVNPRLIHTKFVETVVTEFKDPIMCEDEAYVLKRAHEIVHSEHADMASAFLIFDKHWSTMSANDKKTIWKHVQVLVYLAGKVQPLA
jgi:hypothetical protein